MKMSEVKVSDRRRGPSLSPEDCRCPVCLDIVIEPVTLPCTHTFCKARRTHSRFCGDLGPALSVCVRALRLTG